MQREEVREEAAPLSRLEERRREGRAKQKLLERLDGGVVKVEQLQNATQRVAALDVAHLAGAAAQKGRVSSNGGAQRGAGGARLRAVMSANGIVLATTDSLPGSSPCQHASHSLATASFNHQGKAGSSEYRPRARVRWALMRVVQAFCTLITRLEVHGRDGGEKDGVVEERHRLRQLSRRGGALGAGGQRAGQRRDGDQRSRGGGGGLAARGRGA